MDAQQNSVGRFAYLTDDKILDRFDRILKSLSHYSELWVGTISSPRFYTPKNQSFQKNYHGYQRCFPKNSQIRSEIRIPQWDGMTSSPSPGGTPIKEPIQIIPLQERPLQGPSRPTETLEMSRQLVPSSATCSARFNDRRR